MTAPVIGVEPEASIAEAVRLMLGHKVSGLPVMTRAGDLVGMVSEGDFLRRTELGTEPHLSGLLRFLESSGKKADTYIHTHGRKVSEVMTTSVSTIGAAATLEDAVETMLQRHVKRLPVVDSGKVIGIVSRSDLMRALLDALPSAKGDTNDDRIRDAVEAELAAQTWAGSIRVTVKGGVVTLSGSIFDDRARPAALIAAENVAGVKSVIDEVMWIEPMSGMVVLPDRNAA
jgi:CBS domain-containing protein